MQLLWRSIFHCPIGHMTINSLEVTNMHEFAKKQFVYCEGVEVIQIEAAFIASAAVIAT